MGLARSPEILGGVRLRDPCAQPIPTHHPSTRHTNSAQPWPEISLRTFHDSSSHRQNGRVGAPREVHARLRPDEFEDPGAR